MTNYVTRRGKATLVSGRIGVEDPRFILIDDKNSHLLSKLSVDWYTLVRDDVFGRYFLTRDPLQGDTPVPLRTFNILMDVYQDTEVITIDLPSNSQEDHHLWPGFSKTLRMIQRSNSKCVFKFNTEPAPMELPEYKSAFVFQRSDCLLFEGVSRLRVGLRRTRIGSMEYFGPRELFRSTEHLKDRL